jgi:HAD superfamily hydrolase (TIGR01450 family)
MLEYKVITVKGEDELKDHLPSWQELYQLLSLPISYSPKWLLAWLQSYNDNTIEIDVTFVYQGKKLFAVIPLMIRIENKKRTLKFLSDSCSDYLGIPCRQEINNHLKEIICQRLNELNFTHYNFTNIHENDNSLSFIIYSLSNYGIKPEVEQIEKSISIHIDSNYSHKLDIILSQRQFTRKLKDINELGEIQFKVINSPSKIFLKEIFRVHIEKWEANNVFPQFSDDRRKFFVKKIAETFSEQDVFTVFALYAGENLIAYRMGCISNSTYFDWNTSFDNDKEKYAPGAVLLIKIIKHFLSNNIQQYNFMNGNEKYKYQWATNISGVLKISGENKKEPESKLKPIDTLKLKNIKTKKCLILDIHGIIFKGGQPILPTIEGIKELQGLGIKIGILTNTSAVSVSTFHQMFQDSGLNINEDYIMTSAVAIRNYLLEKEISNCYLIGGEPELPSLLKSSKINLVQNPKEAEIVVVGFSREFSYTTVINAYEAIQNGAEFICSDADMLYASENRNLPGAGWMVSSIAAVCSKEPFIIGKPNDFSLNLLMKIMKVQPNETMFVGDSLESDIKTGKKAGVTTCLHLGGVSQLEEVKLLPTSLRPDFIVSSFEEIVGAFM